MFHVCVQKFDVTGNVEIFFGTKQCLVPRHDELMNIDRYSVICALCKCKSSVHHESCTQAVFASPKGRPRPATCIDRRRSIDRSVVGARHARYGPKSRACFHDAHQQQSTFIQFILSRGLGDTNWSSLNALLPTLFNWNIYTIFLSF